MKSWNEAGVRLSQIVVSAVGSLLLWTLWLGLAALIFVQLYIITANELSIPDPILRRLEAKLEEAGVKATFGRTSFDPAGRVLIENVQLSLPAFAGPVITCRSVYLKLNPFLISIGQFDPREIHLNDVTAYAPAMLSSSGRAEEIIQRLEATIEPARGSLNFKHLSAIVVDVPVTAHGTFVLGQSMDRKPEDEKLGALLTGHFSTLCRQALALRDQISQVDEPALHLKFAPSESGAPTIEILALARAGRIAKPLAVEASNLRVATRVLLFGGVPASEVDVSAAKVNLPGATYVSGLQARLTGRFRMEGGQVDVREVAATADSVITRDVDVRAVSARIYPRPLPRLEAHAVANILGAPLSAHADIALNARTAVVRFDGDISPRLPDVISRQLKVNVQRYAAYDSMTVQRGEAHFAENWKFEKLNARVHVPRILAYNVTLEEGRAEIDLRPNRLYAPSAYARVGTSFARGSYEHEFGTSNYRFLLDGQLAPILIAKWFREWWTTFFTRIQFPQSAPVASVDVRGSWRDGRQSNLFIFADVPKATILGTELDRVRTRLFIRPSFFDGLELLALRGQGNAQGRFTYTTDPETNKWRTLELGMDSTLDLGVAGQLLGAAGARVLAPFKLAQPPHLKVRGQFAAANAPGGTQEKLRIEARTAGEFRFHDFPLQDVSFIATIDRDDIVLDDVEALFAGGAAVGHARVSGIGDQRKLGFDFALEDASLGRVAAGLAEFFAARKGEAPAPPGRFVQEKANVRLDFAASAEGRYDDAFSYRGEGNAMLRGAELGEVSLLGGLSELLKFTALRFTEARTHFKIENTRLVFPKVTILGSNSAIDAHGSYALDKRELEFNAKIFPFQESDNLIKAVVGAVLTPFSNAFEVKLTGTLAKPQWAFVIGPSNFLRSITPGGDGSTKSEPAVNEKDAKRATGDASALSPAQDRTTTQYPRSSEP